MANISEYGYQELRKTILEKWIYVELQQADGTPVHRFVGGRIQVGKDAMDRPIWEDVPGAEVTGDSTTQTITYTVVCTGDDFTDATVAKAVLFDSKVGGSAIATEDFPSFTFADAEDELTVNLSLQVPAVI